MEQKSGDLEGFADTSAKILKTESAAPTTPSKPAAPAQADSFPDPEEDDLDDLDDMLDEFTPSKTEPKTTSKPTKPPLPTTGPPSTEAVSDDELAKQLQAGMSQLLGELETSPDMQAQFEKMMKEFSDPAGLGEAASLGPAAALSSSAPKSVPTAEKETAEAGASSTAATGGEESFQETIKKTMERMRESGDQATAAAASDAPDDVLAEMMKAMQASGMDGEGSEEDFSKMLLGMMEQLTNKEILYEPMKELDDKFPAWMNDNAGKVDEGDMKRYNEQQTYVREIVGRFEKKGYSDDNAQDREYIVERMQKMQAAGSPPPDLVGDMAAAQEAFGAPEEGCPQQ
ncbi:Pex19 protein family-domain-containing protein [Amylocarpus encephaloides]|uniref:Pex19 protein family-domain-containing protein n=1 Tax=Amylocarpus encephaloides TaxID=45428 RepID=A0A9P7YTE5_9HELO|nr:Pex19 protein family-domain-containing protein [Amylocarpus encephaloides]